MRLNLPELETSENLTGTSLITCLRPLAPGTVLVPGPVGSWEKGPGTIVGPGRKVLGPSWLLGQYRILGERSWEQYGPGIRGLQTGLD
jgi:hypothetical protein